MLEVSAYEVGVCASDESSESFGYVGSGIFESKDEVGS